MEGIWSGRSLKSPSNLEAGKASEIPAEGMSWFAIGESNSTYGKFNLDRYSGYTLLCTDSCQTRIRCFHAGRKTTAVGDVGKVDIGSRAR